MSEPLVIVPVRGITTGKSRLAPALDADARAAFNEWLLVHTLEAVRDWRGSLTACVVVSACERALIVAASRGAGILKEAGVPGLNAAAAAGLCEAAARAAASIVVLPCDLPLLSASALDLLARESVAYDVTIAPDEARAGTNVLIVPTGSAFEFCFGEQSFERHVRAARAQGLTLGVHDSGALAFDLDTPHDFERWKRWTAAEARDPGDIVRHLAAPHKNEEKA